jgi:hypothetical protein
MTSRPTTKSCKQHNEDAEKQRYRATGRAPIDLAVASMECAGTALLHNIYMIGSKTQLYKITRSANNVRLPLVSHIFSVYTRSLCVINMFYQCSSYQNVQHCIEITPPRSPPPTSGIRM